MANPANSLVQNLLPVQAYFSVDGVFQTFIGQGQPFYATANPSQSGLNITNSTIDSTTIGATTPSTGVFTNIATTTGTITTQPSGANDIVNYLALQSYAVGISWKAPVTAATTANITLSGPQTIDTVAVVAGNTVLVKNQTNSAENGIYKVNAGAWTYATGCTTWEQYVSALVFVEYGGLAGSAWYCTAQPGGTLGVTAMVWSNFSAAANYTAGTGLTLSGFQFSITPVGTAATYGSASQVPVFVTNASGQVTSVTNTSIAIAANQITSGTIDTARISGSYTGITGVGTLTAGVWNGSTIGVAYGGSGAATFTAGYLKANGTTAFTTVTSIPSSDITGLGTMSTQNANAVAITGGTITGLSSPLDVPSGGTGAATLTGYVKGTGTSALTASATIPSTDITGLGTMSTQNANAIAVTGGTINGTTIGATTATTGAFTTVTASTSLTTPIVQATNSAGLALRNSAGTTQISMGAGGGDNVAINVSTNLNGTNAQIDISPTGTGHVHMKPSGSGAIEIAPTSVGTIDNMTIGATTAKNGSFVDLSVTGTTSFDGSQGTAGQVLTSAGTGATPTWTTPSAYATVTDDTTTNATRYPLFASVTTGNLTAEFVSSTKLQFNPSTGIMTVTGLASPAITNQLATTIRETATVSATAATGTINFDTLTQVVLYYTTSASGNFTVNFRGNSGTSLDTVMSTGQSLSSTFLVTNGATAYYNSAVTIDGNSVTPKWQGGSAPTSGNASSVDSYTYVIVKTGSATFTVLASQTKFA
jgi:hypothetical protein